MKKLLIILLFAVFASCKQKQNATVMQGNKVMGIDEVKGLLITIPKGYKLVDTTIDGKHALILVKDTVAGVTNIFDANGGTQNNNTGSGSQTVNIGQ